MPASEYHFWVYVHESHTSHYEIRRLVYFEYFQCVRSATAREKLRTHWSREHKIALIERKNPIWDDLYPTLLERAGYKPEEADSLPE